MILIGIRHLLPGYGSFTHIGSQSFARRGQQLALATAIRIHHPELPPAGLAIAVEHDLLAIGATKTDACPIPRYSMSGAGDRSRRA